MSRPTSMEPLPVPPEMAALLAAERRAPPPSAARQALILSRVQAAVAAGGAATASAIASTAAATAVKAAPAVGSALAGVAATATVTKPLIVLALVTSTAGAIAGGMAVHKHRQAKVQRAAVGISSDQAQAVTSPAPRSGPARPINAPLFPAEIAPSPTAAPSQPGPAAALPHKATARVAPASRADIEAEAIVLEHARLSLRAGDASAALADVQRHARRFPHGALNEEREALWIRALLRAGERAHGERRAAAFVHRYPDSVHADSVARALREIP